jgi:hypothetical protein
MLSFTYAPETSTGTAPELTPDVAGIDIAGRAAWHCRSRHACITLPAHALSKSKGHLTIWFCPVEDLSQHPMIWRTWASNGIGHTVPLVTDRAEDGNTDDASFSVFWQPSWGHPFVVKFAQGRFFPDMHQPERKFMIEGWIESLQRNHWYRLDLAYDHERSYHALWLNGILAGRSNQHARRPGNWDPVGPSLFLRSPQIAYGGIETHSAPLSEDDVPKRYAAEAPPENKELDRHLLRALTGEGNPHRELAAEAADWAPALKLNLCDPAQAEQFHLQGCPDCLHWEAEGLLIATPQEEPFQPREGEDRKQMYLWCKQEFQGDLYIAFDFMPLEHGGLAILIPRASGMQGEPFLEDYPPRTDGAMNTIHSSDIRMYHWEFFREMDDVRNDVPTHAIVKWPWEIVLAGGVAASPFRFREWNRIEFLQIDDHITGTLNGEVVIDGRDEAHAGKGPTLRHGVFALRCMVRTAVRVRNLTVRVGPDGTSGQSPKGFRTGKD